MLSSCRRPRPGADCVLITGAGGAFGRALALRFASEGAWLALVDISEAALVGTAAALAAAGVRRARVASLACDVANAAAVLALPARVASAGLPPVSVVVSNAALARGEPARVLAVNAAASFYWVAAFVAPAAARTRCVVLSASIMGTVGAAGLAPYCASKWALLGFSESLRLQLQRDGRAVDVVTVLPHAARGSGMFAGIFGGARNSRLAACLRAAAFPLITPAAVAAAVADAVERGGSATFSVPRALLPVSQLLRCLLPLAAHDALTGWLGGYHGLPENWPADEAGLDFGLGALRDPPSQPPAAALVERAPRRRRASSSSSKPRGRKDRSEDTLDI